MQLEGDEEAAAAAQLTSVVALDTQRRGLVEGRWSAEEHARFVIGVAEHGTTWQDVQRFVPGRSVTQVRTHAQKYIAKHGSKALHGHTRGPDGPLAEAGALARLQLLNKAQAAERAHAHGGSAQGEQSAQGRRGGGGAGAGGGGGGGGGGGAACSASISGCHDACTGAGCREALLGHGGDLSCCSCCC